MNWIDSPKGSVAGYESMDAFLAAAAREKQKETEREAAMIAEQEAEFDRKIEPTKQRLRNEWLFNRPDKNQSDFEKVWPLMRENLKLEEEEKNGAAFLRRLSAPR